MAWLELTQAAHKVSCLLGMAAFVRIVALDVPSPAGICMAATPCLLSSIETSEGFASGALPLCWFPGQTPGPSEMKHSHNQGGGALLPM